MCWYAWTKAHTLVKYNNRCKYLHDLFSGTPRSVDYHGINIFVKNYPVSGWLTRLVGSLKVIVILCFRVCARRSTYLTTN